MSPFVVPAPLIRPVLLAFAERIADVPLTFVVAPGGSGKTTLLRAWCQRLGTLLADATPAATVWLDLTPLHADLTIFVGDLIAALRHARPDFGVATLRTLANLADLRQDWRVLLRMLLQELAGLTGPLYCFLDDFHMLPAESLARRMLDEILRAQLPNLRLVIASRGAAPVALLRLRATGALLEVQADDLRLHADAIGALLSAHSAAPEVDLIAYILAQTKGWAMGVLLAIQALTRVPPHARMNFTRTLSQQRDLFTYIATDLLADESPTLIALLEAAALLERCDTDLLHALLSEEGDWWDLAGTGLPDTHAAVAALVMHALDQGLLVGDGLEVWTHDLWRDLLRQRLRARLDDTRWRALHGRVGRVLERRGRADSALAAYAEAGATDALATLLVHVGFDWIAQGHHAHVQIWLERLPADLHLRDPALLHLAGLSLSRSAPDQAITLLHQAADAYRDRGERQAELQIIRDLTMLCYSQNRLPEMQRLIRRTLTVRNLLTDPAVRGSALIAIAARHYLAGHFGPALRFIRLARRYPLGLIERWLAAVQQIDIVQLSGEWETGLQVAEHALADPLIRAHIPSYAYVLILRGMFRSLLGDSRAGLADVQEGRALFADYRLTRFQAVAEQMLARILASLDERADAQEAFAACIRLNREIGNNAVTVAMLARLSVWCWRWGDPDQAGIHAQAALAAIDPGDPPNDMWALAALWVFAQTSDPAQAWSMVQPYAGTVESAADSPLEQHTSLLILADLARMGGESGLAQQYARHGWQIAARTRLRHSNRTIGPLVSRWSGLAVLREGVAVSYVFERLRAIDPAVLSELLLELLADPLPELRARAAALLGELRAASAYTPLRAATKDADARVRAAAAAALPRLDLRPPYRLRIFSLGRFQVLRGDEPIDEHGWGGTMGRRLLARLLVAQGAPISRPHLQDDLWPDADPAAAQHNLRVALNRLNDALEPQRPSGAPAYFILTPGDQVAFNTASDHEWDVRLWLDDLRAAEQAERDKAPDAALACYWQAFARYAGPLLPDVDDVWVIPLRARLAEQFLALGRQLGMLLFDRGQVEAAVAVATRMLEEEPSDEDVWALLMRAHLARGDRAAALRTYTRAVVALRAALDLPPGAELNALAAQARSR